MERRRKLQEGWTMDVGSSIGLVAISGSLPSFNFASLCLCAFALHSSSPVTFSSSFFVFLCVSLWLSLASCGWTKSEPRAESREFKIAPLLLERFDKGLDFVNEGIRRGGPGGQSDASDVLQPRGLNRFRSLNEVRRLDF